TVARSPTTALVMLVMGATVVAITRRPGPAAAGAPSAPVLGLVSPAVVVVLDPQAVMTTAISATASAAAPRAAWVVAFGWSWRRVVRGTAGRSLLRMNCRSNLVAISR